MSDEDDLADDRLTLRLPPELDAGMRASAAFFGRSTAAEWRAAAHVYRRVLRLWSTIVLGATERTTADRDRDACARLVVGLCDGLVTAPRPVEALHAMLTHRSVDAGVSLAADAGMANLGTEPPAKHERSTVRSSVRGGVAADDGDRQDPA